LRVGAGALETAPDATPQINFVTQVERRAVVVRGQVAEARYLIGRKTLARIARIGIERREQFAAGDPGRGASLLDAGDGDLQFLVRASRTALQVVQSFVAENFPPIAFGNMIERLPFLP